MIIRDTAVTLNTPGNESCNSQHFLEEGTSVTAGQRLASHCYCFDPAKPKQILLFYLHPVNPKRIRIQSRIRSRLLGINRRGLRYTYVGTRAKYRCDNLETDWVKSERGVKQGCILSPTLFSLYTEELAARIRRMNVGVKVGEDKILMLLYADNVVVMNESAEELQSVLEVIGGYGRDLGVSFSSEKSKIMVVNRSENEGNITWMLDEKELQQTKEYKYLGVWMSTNGCERTKNEKIGMTNQWIGRLGSAARMRACKYEVLREVWLKERILYDSILIVLSMIERRLTKGNVTIYLLKLMPYRLIAWFGLWYQKARGVHVVQILCILWVLFGTSSQP